MREHNWIVGYGGIISLVGAFVAAFWPAAGLVIIGVSTLVIAYGLVDERRWRAKRTDALHDAPPTPERDNRPRRGPHDHEE